MDELHLPSFYAGVALALTLLFLPSIFILNQSFKKYRMPYRFPYSVFFFGFWVFANITLTASGADVIPLFLNGLLVLFIASVAFWIFYRLKRR